MPRKRSKGQVHSKIFGCLRNTPHPHFLNGKHRQQCEQCMLVLVRNTGKESIRSLTSVHWMSSSYTADQLSILFHKLRALGICFWMGSVNWESEVGKAVRSAGLFPFRVPYSGQFLHQSLQLPVEALLLTSLLVLLNTLHSWEWEDTSTVKSSKYEFFRTPLSPW